MKAGQVGASWLAQRLDAMDTRGLLWLGAMSLMLFTLLLPFSSYVAALPFIQREWRLNNTQAGAVYSAYLAGYAVSALFVVPLTDRFGSKPVILAASLISVTCHLLFPLMADGMVSAVILRVISGVGLVGVYTPGMRIVAERFADRGRGMAMGTFVTAFYAASSVSLAATGALMAKLEWRDAYMVMSAVAAVGLPLAYLLLRNHRHVRAAGSSGRLDLAVLRNRPARLYILGYSLHAAELYVVRVWLPVFLAAALVARGVDGAQAAVTAATVGGIALASGSFGPIVGGIISDRWGRPISASAIFALSGACSWAIGWMAGFPWPVIIGLTVVYGWAISADSAIYSTAVTEVAARAQLGSTMAVHSFLGFTGGVIGPIVVGGILDIAPESLKWGIGFSFVGLLSLVAIAGLMRLRASPEARARPESSAVPGTSK